MNNKQKGTRFERAIVDILSSYPSVYAVDRVAGSLGPYDIIANVFGVPLYVQCKKRRQGRRSAFTKLFSTEIKHTEQLRRRACGEGYIVPAFAMVYGCVDGFFVMLYSLPRSKQSVYCRGCTALKGVCDFIVKTIERDYAQIRKEL